MAGKSTFACALTRALYFGFPLLERKCTKAKVGYMALERNGVAVARLFDAWEMEDVAFLVEIEPSDRERFIEDEILRLNLEVVIVDHLQNLARVPDSNDYATVSNALAPYTAIAKKTGCHIMLLHHQGKTRREGEINVMGSEAFRAAADVLIEATAHGDSHFICAQVRGGIGDLPKTRVTINLATGEAEGIDAHQAEIGDAGARIVKYLCAQPEPLNADEIQEALGLKRETVRSALAEVVKVGTVSRSGAGKRGDPFLYFRSQHAQGTAGTESQNGEILNGAAGLFRSEG